MITLDWIRTIWEYNYWGHHKLWDCLQTVSDDDFKRHVEYSIGSLHVHTVHVMWAEELWLQRIQGKPPVTYIAQDYPSREAIRTHWDAVEARWRDYLATVTEDELNATFTTFSQSMGGDYEQSVREVMVHVVNHGTDHRAQMLRLIHDVGGETFEQDMIYFFREQRL